MPAPLLALCLLFSFSLAAGQLLFKLAADDIKQKLEASVLHAITSPWLVAAVFLYSASTVLWIWILSQMTLSRAYPFALIGAAFVPIFAAFVFGEVLSMRYGIGMTLVIIGVAITQWVS